MKRLVLAVLLLTAFPLAARADTIILTGGWLQSNSFDNSRITFDMTGTDGSRFTGLWEFAVSNVGCSSCSAGAVLSPNLSFSSVPQYEITDARGSATVGGVMYPTPDFTWNFVEFGGAVAITGPSVTVPATPALQNDTLHLTLQTPFTLEGTLAGYDNSVYVAPRQVFSTTLRGQGTASIELLGLERPNGETSWSFLRTTYAFAPAEPVPEPGTLLLIGSGLVGLVAWRRRGA